MEEHEEDDPLSFGLKCLVALRRRLPGNSDGTYIGSSSSS